MPNCKCVLKGNLHKFDGNHVCVFADQFLDKFANWDQYEPNLENPNCVSLCCCSPESPHEESMKFMLLRNKEEDLHRIPFKKYPNGILARVNPLPLDNTPPSSGMLTAVGRNFILYKIVNSL